MKREQYAYQNTARMEKILGTSAATGLSEAEAAERLKKNGINRLSPKRPSPISAFLRTVFGNGSMPLYLLALCLAAPILGREVLFPSLLYLAFLAVYLILFVIREHRLRAHELALLPSVRVIREGKARFISPEELVTGDLLLLSKGDILFTHAHVTTSAEIEVFAMRDGVPKHLCKHGGDCFDETDEPFNQLRPGDVIKSGVGCAFVTDKGTRSEEIPVSDGKTLKNHGNMCAMTTRIAFVLAFVLFAFGFFRACYTQDPVPLAECLLLSAVMVATAGTSFYSLLFDLLFLHKNRKLAEEGGGMFASVADMEDTADVDAFVLPTRSMFLSARYVARYFETAGGRRLNEKTGATQELVLIADALCAVRERCELSMKEEATLGFCARFVSRSATAELYAKASDDSCTHTSYRSLVDGRTFSLVWGDAARLIPGLIYVSEEGKTRILDAKQRDAMLEGAARLERDGYRLFLFAETQTRNAQSGMQETFRDLKLLGFFALRKCSDEEAMRTLAEIKSAGQKAFFIHDGDRADWLGKEIPAFEGVPVIDGTREVFREELAHFVYDLSLPFCIGVNLTPLQKAQVVSALSGAGRRVAASGKSFDDHRMMCTAAVAIAPPKADTDETCHLVQRTACVLAKEHVSTQVETVKSSARILSVFGIFTATLSASLTVRAVLAFLGAVLGDSFLSCGIYASLGVFLDLLALFCFAKTESGKRYDGFDGLVRENGRSLSLLLGVLGGACSAVVLAVFVPLLSADAASFVFLSVFLLLNVGLWYFSMTERVTGLLLYSLFSLIAAAVPFVLGWLTDGRIGFAFAPEALFWALIPVAVLMLIGKIPAIYFKNKYNVRLGEKQ